MKKSKFLFLVVMVIIYCTSLCLLSSANENNVDDPQLADIESDSCTVLNVEHSSLLSSDSLIRTVNAMNSDIEDYYSIPLDNIKSTSNIAITTAFTYNRTLYFEESMKLLNAFKEDIQRYESIYGSDFQVIKETVTNSYNCHAYAWYGAPNNGSCWIDDPYEFINDPHCDRITNNVYDGSVQEGDIVFFYSGQEYTRGTSPNHVAVHSSIVDSIDYVDGIIEIRLRSKFGVNGVYSHSFEATGFIYPAYSNYTVYRYVQGEHDLTYTSFDHEDHRIGCRDGDYSVYESHSNKYVSVSATEHRSTCSDCGHVGYDSHNEQYTYINSGEHRVNCSTCGYSSYEDHDLYIETIYGEDNGCDVACRDCSYSFHCTCDPEYTSDGSEGHYVDCPDGEFSFFEAHTLRYTRVIGDLYSHSVSCTGCDYKYSEGHSWVWNSSTQKYICTDCGYITDEDSVPGIMSLPDPELEAYLASLSDEELEEFIASLPEDQVDRVTALLPSDDEYLTE